MKLIAPDYYPRFRCIADRCRHSCCVGWEIDVDEESLEKYAALPVELGEEIGFKFVCYLLNTVVFQRDEGEGRGLRQDQLRRRFAGQAQTDLRAARKLADETGVVAADLAQDIFAEADDHAAQSLLV